jgi:N-acetyl-anhydromuramoyl-L-alanine amidase
MPFREFESLSPNRGPGPHEGLGVVFHHSELDFAGTIKRMSELESRVSYHCLIDSDGTRCTMVPDGQVAYHAGVSAFLGRQQCNEFLLGVSFAGDTYAAPLSDQQIASALEWLEPRWRAMSWGIDRMTDHRQVAPDRKRDLNPLEWDRLIAAISARFGPMPSDRVVSMLKSEPAGRTKIQLPTP